ncbi:MAG: transferase, partial [Candidatus Methanofastidiosum sp.]|nr:transferase [Methanofastidiosum sp.]
MKPLIIIGAGGFGREVAWLVNDINKQKREWELLGFLDDGKRGRTVEGYPII